MIRHSEVWIDKWLNIPNSSNTAFCLKECYNDMYGAGCTEACGQCRDSKPCHHINGSCVDGCAPGFKGTLCVEGKTSFPYNFQYLINAIETFP